jgi:serine/threonine protein kinase
MVAVEQDAGELPAGTQVLRRYSIVGKLAQGGMAEVYLARPLGAAGDHKLVVLKRVRPHLANDADFVGMFVNEARLAAMINHPNVVQIFDLGDQPRPALLGGGTDWFLAMEYLDGRDMLQVGRACRANNKAVPFDVTARIIADACAGLDHAHGLKSPEGKSLDLVHRDMSPENVLITFDGQVKVVDFGIAKASDNLIKTQAGQIKGKLGYVAPEAILGKPVDARADVFAIGATLYLFLSGRPAFSGTNPMEIFERSLKPPVPPREVNNRVPEPLDAICMKALAQDRDKRYRSAGEVRIALEQYLQGTGRPLGPVQLGQFMRILFPPDKDPVRQRIDKLLADAPPDPAGASAPSAGASPLAPPLPSAAGSSSAPAPVLPPSPLRAGPRPVTTVPDPVVVEEDNEKTNIVPHRPEPVVAAPRAPNPVAPPPVNVPRPKAPSPPHLRSVGITAADDQASRMMSRPPAAGDAPPTVEMDRASISSSDGVTMPVSRDQILRSSGGLQTAELEIEPLSATSDLDAPTIEVHAVSRPTSPRSQVDVVAALFQSDKSGPAEGLRPPPFEPSGLVERPMPPPTALPAGEPPPREPPPRGPPPRGPPPRGAPARGPPLAFPPPAPTPGGPLATRADPDAAAPPFPVPPPAFDLSSPVPPSPPRLSPPPPAAFAPPGGAPVEPPEPPEPVPPPAFALPVGAPMEPSRSFPSPSSDDASVPSFVAGSDGQAAAPQHLLPAPDDEPVPAAPSLPGFPPARVAPEPDAMVSSPPSFDAGVVGPPPAGAGPGGALKGAMFAFGALSGAVVVGLGLWLTGLLERLAR